jgi:hypothetical protein
MKTMDLEFLTWSQLKQRAELDREQNGKKYEYLLDLAIAWLEAGGRLALHRWAMRRDFETHLVLDGDTVLMVECDGARGSFCRLDGLMYDEFLMIPDTHEIGENTPYPTWIYGDLEVPQMRITK